ncbi:MAG: glycosyltransferase [Phycisphaerae bacterium]|jgi:hypothetical protein
MSASKPIVVHLLAGDACRERLAVLHALVEQPAGEFAHRVIRLESTAPPYRDAELIRTPLELGWLKTRMLRRTLAGDHPFTILHAWSPRALAWCPADAPLLVEAQSVAEAESLWQKLATGNVAISCPTESLRRQLGRRGIPAESTVLLRDVADGRPADGAERTELRERLGWSAETVGIVAVPPASRATGTFVAAWAVMVLGESKPNVRLLLRKDGREARRVMRLAEAIERSHLVTLVDRSWTAAMMQAADIAVYLPGGSAPLGGLAAAMAAGCPLATTGVPSVREVLRDGVEARFCPPADPETTARLLLKMTEQPEETARLGQAARARATELFGVSVGVAAYERVYANLAAGRRAAAVCVASS